MLLIQCPLFLVFRRSERIETEDKSQVSRNQPKFSSDHIIIADLDYMEKTRLSSILYQYNMPYSWQSRRQEWVSIIA